MSDIIVIKGDNNHPLLTFAFWTDWEQEIASMLALERARAAKRGKEPKGRQVMVARYLHQHADWYARRWTN